MPTIQEHTETLKLARRPQGVTAREIDQAGIHRQVVTRLVEAGQLERVIRGVYRLPERSITEHHALALAAATVPHASICLLSALQFHCIGTHVPSEVWIAIDRRTRRPALKFPPLRVVRFTGAALTEGLETQHIEGRVVRVYNVEKTIADCFKYRNKIGIDVALEALRDGWSDRRFTLDELEHYAEICRVRRVMRPYLEALSV